MDTSGPPGENPAIEDFQQEAERRAATAIAAVRDAYEPRVLRLLAQIRDILVAAGLEAASEPYDMSDDSYRWALDLRRPGYPYSGRGRLDCLVEVVESMQNDEEMLDGINFRLSLTDWSGHDFYFVEPYNFTPQVWVSARDRAAVEARWRLIEDADFAEILPRCL